jgi:hypothetical protein
MPPEALHGNSDTRSDVFALGLTLYELATLRPAFSSRDQHDLIEDILHSEPPNLSRVNPNVPRDLATIIHKAIEREPHQRYVKAQDLADDLECFIEDRPIRARRITVTERLARWSHRNRALAASLFATTALLVLTALGGTLAAIHILHSAAETRNALVRERELADELMADDYAKSMRLAGIALQRPNGGLTVTRSLEPWRPLKQNDTDRRGWEWHVIASKNCDERLSVFDVYGQVL